MSNPTNKRVENFAVFAGPDGARGRGRLISDGCAAMTASPHRIGVPAENAGTLGQIRSAAGERSVELHNGQEGHQCSTNIGRRLESLLSEDHKAISITMLESYRLTAKKQKSNIP